MPPSRTGHGPFFTTGLGAKFPFLTWPVQLYRRLFYEPRPDLHTTKTRAPEWRKLQSELRFFQALFCYLGPPGHILWNIKWPFLGVMVVSSMVALYTYYSSQNPDMWQFDRNMVFKDAFRAVSFAMSLLLAFRVNRTYERWREARSSMAGVGNGATSVCLQAATWIEDEQLVDDFRRWCIVWPFSILQVVTNSKQLDPRAAKYLHPEELAIYSGSRKGRQVVVTNIRRLAAKANLSSGQFLAMETAIMGTWKSAGDSLRIRFQAMPHGLTLMCTGFVEIWCLLLPLGLWGGASSGSWLSLLAMAAIAMLLLGCDEMANQMEEPFKLMPLDDIMVTYDRDINRIVDEIMALKRAEATVNARQHAEVLAAIQEESNGVEGLEQEGKGNGQGATVVQVGVEQPAQLSASPPKKTV